MSTVTHLNASSENLVRAVCMNAACERSYVMQNLLLLGEYHHWSAKRERAEHRKARAGEIRELRSLARARGFAGVLRRAMRRAIVWSDEGYSFTVAEDGFSRTA